MNTDRITFVLEKKHLHFHEPFTIAYESVDSAEVIFITLKDGKGHVGYGSASPDEEVTGESTPSVLEVLKNKLPNLIETLPTDLWYRAHELIQHAFASYPSAQHAIEEAYLNLYCQKNGLNLQHLFGGYRTNMPIMMTLGINTLDETLKDAQKYIKQGFTCIKLKVGLNVEEDIDRIRATRAAIGPSIQICVDANQGYSVKESLKLLKALSELSIDFLEQPVNKDDIEGLSYITTNSPIPIFADESAVSIDSIHSLFQHNCVDGVNIKLMKCGGPLNFIRIFHLAKRYNKKIMIGCMYESNISITTGAALALALPIDYADLDGGVLTFSDDSAKGGAIIKKGNIFCSQLVKL